MSRKNREPSENYYARSNRVESVQFDAADVFEPRLERLFNSWRSGTVT